MADATIKIVQQGGRFIGDDGGFDVIAREGANRVKRIPICDHEDLNAVWHFAPQQCSALVAGQFSQFRKNGVSQMIRIQRRAFGRSSC